MTPKEEAINAINYDIKRAFECLQGCVNRALKEMNFGVEPRKAFRAEMTINGVDQLRIEGYVNTIAKLQHAAKCIENMLDETT